MDEGMSRATQLKLKQRKTTAIVSADEIVSESKRMPRCG